MDREFEGRVERVQEQARRQARRAVEERVDELKQAAAEAAQHVEATEGPLVGLVRAVLPEGQKVYLAGRGVAELDVFGLNQVLQRHGLVIRHDLPSQEVPELVVKVRTTEASWEAATRVWLAPFSPPEEPLIHGIPAKYMVSGV